MPVPRTLSSSCGTCVRCELPESAAVEELVSEEMEQLVAVTAEGYRRLWQSEDS